MPSANSAFDEKRDFIRMKIGAPVDVSLQVGNTTLTGKCLDLSGGGLSVEISQSEASTITVDTEIEATLASDHGHSPMLRAQTRVARIKPGSAADTQILGLVIEKMLD